ncbi:hypothetical protein [Caulobacter sp. 602-1]|uniref:hypothetical protein n=1 Tax=Caulobacter sp. 602-1 TaxID=2492472 RepID=UPI000F62E1D2|nr:hypothetical protein [Caulobacter sp. 602-1]RRN64643.1 hypothetical protein EIK80_11450 [Caulobacter sp. 602-1]
MSSLPIARGAYRRRDNSPIRLVNAFFEQDPTNVRDQVSMIGRPGLKPFATLAGSSVAGVIRREDDADGMLCVSGTSAYAVSTAGLITTAGTGVAGTGRVRMATDGANTMIVRAGVLYLHLDTTVSVVEMPDNIEVLDVVFLAGRFWIATVLDGRVYFTVPGETTVDALNYFSAESSPDKLEGLAVSGDELILLGRSSIEYWTPVADPDLPAQRVLGRASKVGCASVHSIAMGDLAAWVGDDNQVYRSGEALPIPISDAGMVEIIRRSRPGLDAADPAKTLGGWMFSADGHSFYVLDVPGFGTHAFDFTTSQWCEFASLGRSLFNASCGAKLSEGRWVIGGTFDGKLRVLSPDALDDDGDPLVRVYPALLPVRDTDSCFNVILECSVGSASLHYPVDNPKVGARVSRDNGKTWLDWTYASLGLQGDYTQRPAFKGLGRMDPPSHLFEFRVSDPIEFTLRAARYNEVVR